MDVLYSYKNMQRLFSLNFQDTRIIQTAFKLDYVGFNFRDTLFK